MSRREEIKAIARRQFARNGYSDTSMRDIAEESGLLAGSLYSHFKSKMELVREIVATFYDELIPCQEEAIAEGGTGAEQFDRMIESVCGVCAKHQDELTILHYDWHVLSSLDELADIQARSVETLDLWRQAIDHGKADGSIDAGIDTDVLMRITTSSVHALIDTIRYADRPLDEGASALVGDMLRTVLLHGVTGPKPRSKARSAPQAKPASKPRSPRR